MTHNDSGSAWGYGLGSDLGKRIIEETHAQVNELRATRGLPPIDWTVAKPKARQGRALTKAAGAA